MTPKFYFDPVVNICGFVITIFSPTALGVSWVSQTSGSPNSRCIFLKQYLDGWPPGRGFCASTRWAGGHFSETVFDSVKWPTVSAQVFRSFPAPCANAIQSCVVSRLRTQSRRGREQTEQPKNKEIFFYITIKWCYILSMFSVATELDIWYQIKQMHNSMALQLFQNTTLR